MLSSVQKPKPPTLQDAQSVNKANKQLSLDNTTQQKLKQD